LPDVIQREAASAGVVMPSPPAAGALGQLPDLSEAVNPQQPAAAGNAAAGAQAQQQGGADIENLIERISRRLFRELDVERERRGITKWA
jgi:hypothetical protein